jgi:hypothetical protein
MVYLISFDPASGESDVLEYPDAGLGKATEQRLQLELRALRNGVKREVVILSAKNLDDLRTTHARYFGDSGLKNNIASLLGRSSL